jgi:DNA-binding beta-propeller fold protein YncE
MQQEERTGDGEDVTIIDLEPRARSPGRYAGWRQRYPWMRHWALGPIALGLLVLALVVFSQYPIYPLPVRLGRTAPSPNPSPCGSGGPSEHVSITMAGIAADAQGNVYVANPGRDAIQKLTRGGKQVAAWGCLGTGVGQFNFGPNEVEGVAVSRLGTVYVADSENRRLQVFDAQGRFVQAWSPTLPGASGSQLYYPVAVTVDGRGAVYVVDFLGNRVVHFDRRGRVLAVWGSTGHGAGQFSLPDGIAVDRQGNIYVADRDNNRIQVFDGSGRFKAAWNGLYAHKGLHSSPTGIAPGEGGGLYVIASSSECIREVFPGGGMINWKC